MLQKLKRKYGRRQLKNLQKRRIHEAKSVNFDNIKSLGIIYPASEESQFNVAKKLVNSISGNIEVKTLGYSNTKELAEFHIQPQKFSFFCLADLNWHFKPVSDTCLSFSEIPFDVLIDLSKNKVFPIEYVLSYSKAKLIVGRYKENSIYDFMIEAADSNEFFFDQVMKYLKMIKTA
jgi:hypothetical protein